MLARGVGGIGVEGFNGVPVLHHGGALATDGEEARVGFLRELLEHACHGKRHGNPEPGFPEGVDVHADKEDDDGVMGSVGGVNGVA